MTKIRIPIWMAILAVSFFANFAYSGIYLPLRGMPSLGIEVQSTEAAIKIWRVEPNSPAAVAGAQEGDVIRFFNGHPVRNLNDYLIPEQLMSQQVPTSLIVERGGRSLHLEVRNSGTYIGSLSAVNQLAALFWIFVG